MNAKELIQALKGGALTRYSNLYANVEAQSERLIDAVKRYTELFGDTDAEVCIFSVPGRSEILGNHTDHNKGCVLAGAINRDIIAVAARNSTGTVNLHSEGYAPVSIAVDKTSNPDDFENYSSAALIAGTVNGFRREGYSVGGFNAYSNTEVLKGSGISSSAAYEVMIGNILSHVYNDGKIPNRKLAEIAQYAENAYFGKPCGLMDQMACAVGGFVFIDFEKPEAFVEPLEFSLSDEGYSLCIVNTGGNHADLNEDYASVPAEMKAVAGALGSGVLREISEAELYSNIPALRERVGDRAILRAIHYFRENDRVNEARDALKAGDVAGFLSAVRRSGESSFKYLQNVYTNKNVSEQGLSLALALTDGFLGKEGALRVHGGGFAGTIQVFLPTEALEDYLTFIDFALGEGAAMPLGIRPVGACRLF